MFKQNKLQIFSFRKIKGYGLASAVIASMFLAQGVVSADVVTTPDGTKTTLSNDKASVTVESNHFKDSNDKSAKELYEAKEYEADKVTTGKDTVSDESKTVVSYETENGTKLKEDVTKTATEEKELNYKIEGPSGKEYTGTSTPTSNVNADLEKQDTIQKDGEKYKYVRTETTQGNETVLTDTHFNDVETKASVEGMYNNDGSIKYDKIKDGSRVWVLEEKEDGTYGNYTLIENAQGLSDEKIQEAAKTATTKFSKAEVEKLGGIKETDSIVVYETNTYAARKQTSEQFGKDFYFNLTVDNSKFYKSYIDEIYKVGLDGLEKQGDKYYYKGKDVPTIEDFKTIYSPPTENTEDGQLGSYLTDESNKYYISSYGFYAVPTTYYDVLSDFLIAHPDSPLFAGKADDVFWGAGNELFHFRAAFAARLMNESLKSKYNLNIDTPNFSNKPLDSKAEGARPTEKKTYSFVRTDLKGDEDSFTDTHRNYYNESETELWKHEIGLSYSPENVERVRKWVKGFKSMNGESVTDPFNNKPSSEITQQEYSKVVFNDVFGEYVSTYKDQFTPDQIKEFRTKFGDSVFDIIGNVVQPDIENDKIYVFYGSGSNTYRNSLGVVTENTETFTYHDVITPLRAYRLTADNNTIRHIYEQVKRGSVIATHKDTQGNELLPQESIKTNEYDGEAYTTSAKQIPNKVVTDTTPEGFTRTTTTTYTLVENPANKDGNVVGGETITVPYVYKPTNDVRINGSVIATYSTEDGEKLADDVAVKTDAPSSEAYTTERKTFDSVTKEDKVNGFTRVTTTRYELIETPTNADGQVEANKVITVPYVYRKVVTETIKGSVIATYKDEEGTILASEEKVITNQNAGTYYAAAAKTIQASASSKVTENGREVTLITYELIKTPDNETGEVVGGETLVVPYVYRKVVTNKLVPNNPPVVEDETIKVTRFHSDTGEELQSDVTGFEDAPKIIGDYQFTGKTEMNEGNDVQTHIYTKIVTEIPNETPKVDVPEAKVTRFHSDSGEELQSDVTGFEDAPKTIGNYQFTGKTEMNDGNDVQTHIYTKIVTEIPNEAPKVEKDELKLTRFMLEDRKTEIKDMVEGFVKPIEKIGDYTYTGVTDSDEGGAVITHIYKLVETEVPNVSELPKDSPVHDKPEFNGGVIPNDAPVHDKPEYNGGTVPNDAPVHDKPEFNGGVIPNDAPVHDKPQYNGGVVPNDSPVHDKPKLDVPTPEIPTPTPELPKPETPSVETPKPSQPLEQKPQEKYVTKELPNTGGSESSALGLLGFAGVMGSLILLKKQKED